MQFLVVETESDAKAAVEHLKRNKACRATFLPVATVHGRLADVEKVKGCPGYIGIASELAAYEPKYQGVIRESAGPYRACRGYGRGACHCPRWPDTV